MISLIDNDFVWNTILKDLLHKYDIENKLIKIGRAHV